MSAGRAGAPTPEGLPAGKAKAAPFLQLGDTLELLLSQVGPQQGCSGTRGQQVPWSEGWPVGKYSSYNWNPMAYRPCHG